jgi:acetyl esterase
MYAQRLAEAGVDAAVREYDGMLHGFLACAGAVDAAWQALDETGVAVARAMRR